MVIASSIIFVIETVLLLKYIASETMILIEVYYISIRIETLKSILCIDILIQVQYNDLYYEYYIMVSVRATLLETLTNRWVKRYWYKDWNKIFIQCTHCKMIKELCDDNFYKNKNWYMWYCSYCKDCHKVMRDNSPSHNQEYNINYYNENKNKLLEYHRNYSKTNKWKAVHKNSRDMKKHWIRQKTQKFIRENNLRPLVCPICWKEKLIQAHHIDYDKRNEIVFCCNNCHSKIHSWIIKEYNIIDLLQHK